MIKKSIIFVALISLLSIFLLETAFAVRIKDLVSIKGIRKNQLVGYGLIVGLNGTGDKSGAEFTMQSLGNMIQRMGIHIDKAQLKVKNVAAVMVTAELPPFARIGSKIDIMVSSVGDAKSLSGGMLLLTPLRGVDGKVYALAQGGIALGGAGGYKKAYELVARLPSGASVEREIRVRLNGKRSLTLSLINPDFTTVTRIVQIINTSMGKELAAAIDSGAVKITIPEDRQGDVANFIAGLETLEIVPDGVAKIILNEKTGTVVIGEKVTISTVAIAHGDLTIRIKNQENAIPPRRGEKPGESLVVIPKGSTIGDLVKALNALGVKPADLISIFQSIKAAGALQAELEII
ncbi:MAG: flagellar basal body P-ring protein FlgI [Deltaproteobacteria bacterium]|nr:flagellar basal body P-ring protein FlgI [Deltaproteobacteria bacterium]